METEHSTFIFAIERKPDAARVFLKGCPLACDWCSRPEGQSFQPELSRDASKCQACGECLKACTRRAIRANGGKPTLDRARCDECFHCSTICTQGGIAMVGQLLRTGEVLGAVREMQVPSLVISGGEPLSRPAFTFELLRKAKEIGLATRVETCGYVPWGAFETVLPAADTICLEIKLMDDRLHRRLTGVSNELILRNAERLAATDVPVVIRIPIVPGRTDVGDNIPLIIERARRIGAKNVELFPYSPVGNNQWSCLEKVTPPLQLTVRPMEQTETFRHLAQRVETFHRMVARYF